MSSLSDSSIVAGASASTETIAHTVDQSIRFNSAEKCFITRDTGGVFAGNKTATISMWVKRGLYANSGTRNVIYGAFYGSNNRYDYMQFQTDDSIEFGTRSGGASASTGSSVILRKTNQKFKDPTAWYHILIVIDSGQSAPDDRFNIYVNGNKVSDFATKNTVAQDQLFYTMSLGVEQNIGAFQDDTSYSQELYFDGYITEHAVIDGTAYGPENFGEFTTAGIWRPIDISGLTFGSKGIYYKGQDSSSLGDDSSGNGNDGTVRNLAAHDQVSDSPTNNFAVINSIYADDATAGNALTLAEGNLKATGGGSSFSVKGFTFNLPKSGKWYFEYTIGGTEDGFGFIIEGEQTSINASNGPGNVSAAQGGGIQYRGWRNGGNYTVTFSTYASSAFSAGDLHQVAIDVDNGKWYYGIANSYYANDGGTDGNPSAGTNHTTTFDFAGNDVVLLAAAYSGTQHWNFGQNGTFNGTKTAQGNSDANGFGNFFYAVPTGYLALCSRNVGA